MPTNDVLAELERLGIEPTGGPAAPVSGGSISRAFRVETRRGPAFVKLEPRGEAERLEAEAAGLDALSRSGTVAVPAVLALGVAGEDAFLVLEWLDLGRGSPDAERRLGAALAAMHRTTGPRFGWTADNYIGRTPQPNTPAEDWTAFFRDRRLAPQLERARRNGIGREAAVLGDELIANLERLLAEHRPEPSLVHGDLWGGNWGATRDGTPYLFDPAVYHADREVDIAMTRLFGGFGREFYRAYDEAWPPAPGRDRRTVLYNLYHVLNHFNLFGSGYRAEVIASLRRLAAD